MAKNIESRSRLIKDTIVAKGLNVFDCFEHYGLEDIYDGTRREQQIKCPGFHGDDRRKSARIYENGTMFCWACDKSYDIFAFEMQYTGQSFTEVLYTLATRHHIEVERSEDDDDGQSSSSFLGEIKSFFKSVEDKKPQKRFEDHFKIVSDKIIAHKSKLTLEQYQTYWYIIDQISWRVFNNMMEPKEAIVNLDKLYREVADKNV